jgi:hypothetical protein
MSGNGRLHFHVIEARRINRRRARGANTDRTAANFYQKLAEAMRHGATITEEIMLDGLTNNEAYRIEKQKIEELHKQHRGQLWNTIDERLIGITWEEFKRKQREESFQRGSVSDLQGAGQAARTSFKNVSDRPQGPAYPLAVGAEAVQRIVRTIAVSTISATPTTRTKSTTLARLTMDGHTIVFKIDYFDRELSMRSPECQPRSPPSVKSLEPK